MRPLPSRDDVAMELILHACGDSHAFPGENVLRPTGTETGRSGATVNVRRIACRRCGTVQVTRWGSPGPTVLAITTLERPAPADVPGIAERALRMTDREYAEALASLGFPGGVPAGFAPDRRATATPQRLDLRLPIQAGQLALLDRNRPLTAVLPIPPHAESAGIIDAVPGAVLLWTPIDDGELPVTVVIAAADPGRDPAYPRSAEISCRFPTGHVVLRPLTGPVTDLPPLPAGHGDYRVRFSVGVRACLLHIWNQPRTKPSPSS